MSFYKKGQNKNTDLETWFKFTSTFPDVFMINRIVLFAPVSYLENPPDRHLGTPADGDKTPDWKWELFIRPPLGY